MTNEHNSNVAKHYAALRPALHEVILKRLIRPSERFRIGLGVGCGTGYSTVALAEYCKRVIGMDPNQSMLDKATAHPKISYVNGCGDNMSVLGQDQFDIVSFAGTLSYTKTKKMKARTWIQSLKKHKNSNINNVKNSAPFNPALATDHKTNCNC